ncbi:MAG: polyhydroxyalkanoate synthesis repressor PhaR [Rickettsiales bacterium]|nr:polyhydroxyalkanoate synthesis repressor PhaR [Rickettsiales bacterium]|tara:strand:- start:336 stop:929 length:594 start_codon:yes stop_codon:yes gene_type:complete
MKENKDIIVINKYSSRRLYNTNSSEYVTLEDLCKLINAGKNFKIIDKDSGKDITNQYLLQIISDLENKEGSVFPQDVLKDIILSYNNTAQKFMPDLLSKTFEVFRQQQENFLKAFNAENRQNKPKNESSDFFEEWQKSQTDIMEKMMQPWIKNPIFNDKKDKQSSDSEATKINKNHEIDMLRRQIDELRDIITKKNT